MLTTSSMIALFLSKITPKSAVLIHSLPLRINRISSSMQAASVETHALSRSLRDLAGNVSVMMRLNTFSVIVLAPPMSWVIPAGTRLRRTDLIDLLKSLPTSCVYLEINTDGIGWYEEGAHIWSIIVDMMIRMEHIKLQLNFICESVFLATAKNQNLYLPLGSRPWLLTQMLRVCRRHVGANVPLQAAGQFLLGHLSYHFCSEGSLPGKFISNGEET